MTSPTKSTRSTKDRHRRRWTWGLTGVRRTEKNVFGRFIDDVTASFAEVSFAGLPTLWLVMMTTGNEFFGIKNATLIAWLTTVLGVAVMRGRLLSPPGVDYDGWVSLAPSLLVFRVLYYNLALVTAGYLGGLVGSGVGLPILSIPIAIGIAIGAVAAFPWTTERFREWLAEWDPQV